MSILGAIQHALEEMETAGAALPAEIVLASDEAWDELAHQLNATSRFPAKGIDHLQGISIRGVSITCPRLTAAREAYFDDRGFRRGQLDPSAVQEHVRQITSWASWSMRDQEERAL